MKLNEKLRLDFPFLNSHNREKNVVYLDNAATTQKPKAVIESITNYYSNYNSNVHRGEHYTSNLATERFEETRKKIKRLLNADFNEEIIFTSGTTQSINLVAQCFVDKFLDAGDEILIGPLEHHANIVPWQIACSRMGAKIKEIELNKGGSICVSRLKKSISQKTKLIVFQHTSNVTGESNNIKEIINLCKKAGIYSFIDGAQAIAHEKINVKELNCDFFCFSGHKLFGPTGTGGLYGKKELLKKMPPYMGGGEMIETVSMQDSSWNGLPHKFEAGTPNIAGFIGLGEAVSYVSNVGFDNIKSIEKHLSEELYNKLCEIEGVIFYGDRRNVPICTFNIKGIHSFDIGSLLSEQGVCVRTGHLCAQPATVFFKSTSFIRVSLSFYNTSNEISIFIKSLKRAIKMLSK